MRHLVIGGAGFIGVNIASRLLQQGEEVTVFDNCQRAGADENLAWLGQHDPAPDVVTGDIRTDLQSLERLVAQADVVYHLAGQVAVTTSIANPRDDFEANALGTINVLEALRLSGSEGVLIYSSTNKVYGGMEDVALSENETRYAYGDGRAGIGEEQQLDFHSPYGCSKGSADQYVRDYARVFGIRSVVLRQSCIYGPRQFGIEDQGWLAWFCIAAVLGWSITIFGTGKQVRDVLHIDDLGDLMLRIAEDPGPAVGRIYNVGGGPESALSLVEALALLERGLGRSIEYDFAPARVGDQPIYVSDISRVTAELGWSPRRNTEDGVHELCGWVVSNAELLRSVLAQTRRP
jgi:CDP-paratose 2-epimerase